MVTKSCLRSRKLRDLGLCTCCGKPAKQGNRRCEGCLIKSIEYNKRKISERKEKGLCIYCEAPRIPISKNFCESCVLKQRSNGIRYKKNLIKEVMEAYGNRCACCGESNTEFLQLDHVNNDGSKQRKELNTDNIYPWARRNGFPDTLQLLCANCNFSKFKNGICYHDIMWLNSIKQL